MRIVIQRVLKASVTIDGNIYSSIENGLCIFLGIELEDNETDVEWLSAKTANLRIFNDEAGVMNKNTMEIQGEVLVISQFTLHAQTKKGNRPSYIKAARPEQAIPLYEKYISELTNLLGKSIKTGVFGAEMKVELLNDGPVTIIIDSKSKE